jgi:hypothetical protein
MKLRFIKPMAMLHDRWPQISRRRFWRRLQLRLHRRAPGQITDLTDEPVTELSPPCRTGTTLVPRAGARTPTWSRSILSLKMLRLSCSVTNGRHFGSASIRYTTLNFVSCSVDWTAVQLVEPTSENGCSYSTIQVSLSMHLSIISGMFNEIRRDLHYLRISIKFSITITHLDQEIRWSLAGLSAVIWIQFESAPVVSFVILTWKFFGM